MWLSLPSSHSFLEVNRLQFSVMKNEHTQSAEQVYQEALDYLYGFIDLEKRTIDRYHASKMDRNALAFARTIG